MEFTVYIYAGKYALNDMVPFRCPRCGRIVFKHNTSRMEISNSYGASIFSLKPGESGADNMPAVTEHRCHSCKSRYHILYR